MNETASWIPVFRKAQSALLWTLFILIGFLQMQRIRVGVLTAYGADVVAPAVLYVATRDGKSLGRFVGLTPTRPALIAVLVFLLSAGWEVCQKLRFIPGVFDPLDFLAYAIGVAVPFTIDLWLSRKEGSR